MTVVANFFGRLIKAVPVLIAKVATFLLLLFTLGLFSGYAIATMHLSPALLAIPVVAMFVMWYRLDEGVLVLVLLGLLVLFFPGVIESIWAAAVGA